MSKREHISFSEYLSWINCQWRWSLDYKEDKRAPVFSKFMDFGTAIHGALEKYKNPNKDYKVSLDTAVWYYELMWRTLCIETRPYEHNNFEALSDEDKEKSEYKRPLTDKQVDEWCLVGEKVLRNLYHLKELEDAKVLFVEHPLYLDISRTDGTSIKFKGFIDLVIKTKDKRGKSLIYIIDYKTCSWGWNQEKQRDQNLQMQLRLYKHFFSKEFNLDPRQIRTAFVLLKRRPQSDTNVADWLPISAGPTTVARAVKKLNVAITGMVMGVYKKNLNKCINEYDDVCPFYNSPDCPKDTE